MVLELDEKEKEMVKQALESFENELRDLIGRTDKKKNRAELHGDEAVARRILEKLGRGEEPVGAIEGYCDNLSMELAGWKTKVAGVVEKLDRVSTGDKEKVVGEVNELHMVMEELGDRIARLRRECATSWKPEREEIEKKVGWLRQRVEEIAETIPQSDIGG
jgi:predicted nuclease with TOPRIM domain